MTDFTLDELKYLRDSLEADMERSSWHALTFEECQEVELLEYYVYRAKAYKKLVDLTRAYKKETNT